MLTFTAEEVWRYMPTGVERPLSVQLSDWPKPMPEYLDKELETKWNELLQIRGELTKALEQARRSKAIGHSLDAHVDIYADGDTYNRLAALGNETATMLIVSQAQLHEGIAQAPENAYRSEEIALAAAVRPAEGTKCERCWIYSTTVGEDSEHTTLCKRCAGVLK